LRAAASEGIEAAVQIDSAPAAVHEDAVFVPYTVPLFELRRLVSMDALPQLLDFVVEYVHWDTPHRFEVRHGVPVRGSDLRLATPPSLLLRKLLTFRSWPAKTRLGCWR